MDSDHLNGIGLVGEYTSYQLDRVKSTHTTYTHFHSTAYHEEIPVELRQKQRSNWKLTGDGKIEEGSREWQIYEITVVQNETRHEHDTEHRKKQQHQQSIDDIQLCLFQIQYDENRPQIDEWRRYLHEIKEAEDAIAKFSTPAADYQQSIATDKHVMEHHQFADLDVLPKAWNLHIAQLDRFKQAQLVFRERRYHRVEVAISLLISLHV